jgi:hypothetical protein
MKFVHLLKHFKMKFFIAFILCLFCTSFNTSAIYSVDNQGITSINTVVPSPKKLSYKERVTLKYLKFKVKATTNKAARGFLVAAIIFLIIGIIATFSGRRSTQSMPLDNVADGCLSVVIGIVSLIISGVMFIAAAVAAI